MKRVRSSASKSDASGRAPSAVLRATSFIGGFVVAMAACSLIGWQTSSVNIFRHFDRFHTRLSPESYFQPTAREVLALAHTVLSKDKINVVLGGSSVFYGVGQPEGQTIADNLRRELGDNYRVINLAMRGGAVSGIAEETAEMLIRERYRVIFVSDIAVASAVELLGSAPYEYFFWDARAQDRLIDWPPRERLLEQPWYSERRIGSKLNKYLYFTDLWQMIGYKYIFTLYSSLIPSPFWQARKNLPDNEIDPPPQFRYRYTDAELRLIKSLARLHTEQKWIEARDTFEEAVPDVVRHASVIAVCENSPWLLQQSSPGVQANRKIERERTVRQVMHIGPTSLLACEGFGKDDYIDRVHLSISGAAKIAPRLAEKVRDVAREKGWVQ